MANFEVSQQTRADYNQDTILNYPLPILSFRFNCITLNWIKRKTNGYTYVVASYYNA